MITKDQLARQIMGNECADKYFTPVRSYDLTLDVTEDYKNTLPDLQNDVYDGIRKNIEHVGIHNFKLPLKYDKKDGGVVELETRVTGTVSLDAAARGVNLSRIILTFYQYKDRDFNTELLEEILQAYRERIGSYDARIFLNFSYPIIQKSLRSENSGYQYYNVTIEVGLDRQGKFTRKIYFDFVYSSACPCSNELSEHARKYRNRAAIPHSQRSVARITAVYDKHLWIEDIQQWCLNCLKTEVQVAVKRTDEQAFAELNGTYPKFVEDAARLLYQELSSHAEILDFRVILSHLESLHGHNAISVISKGVKGGLCSDFTVEELNSLVR